MLYTSQKTNLHTPGNQKTGSISSLLTHISEEVPDQRVFTVDRIIGAKYLRSPPVDGLV